MAVNDVIDGMNDDDTKKPENWKNQLSPAFNEEEIFYSLSVLGVFYVVYAVVKATFDVHDSGASDEELFIQSCYCSLNQRVFYRFWFSFCCVMWFYIHTYSFLSALLTKRFPEFGDAFKIFLAFCIVFIEYCWRGVCKIVSVMYAFCKLCKCKIRYAIGKDTRDDAHKNFDFSEIHNIRDQKLALKMKNNLTLLWFQYCKMYVIGYTGFGDDKIELITESGRQNVPQQNNEDNTNQRERCCLLECSKQKQKQNKKVLQVRSISWKCRKPKNLAVVFLDIKK